MNFTAIFPTFSKFFSNIFKPRPKSLRPIADRIWELEDALRQFLPWRMAAAIAARLFAKEPEFDLYAECEANTRYWLNRAINEFRLIVDEFLYKYGLPLTDELLEQIKRGSQLYFPQFLPRIIV